MTGFLAVRQPAVSDDVGFGWSRDWYWLLSLWVLAGVFTTVAVVRSYDVGVPFRDPDGAIFRWRITVSLLLFAVLIVVDAARVTERPEWSTRRLAAAVRHRWPQRRLVAALSGLLAYLVVYACYRNLKSWDAFSSRRDGSLLRLDHWLFLGHSPAVVLHDLLGQSAVAHVLAAVYASFSWMVSVSFVAALVFSGRLRDGYVFLAAAAWTWILGVGSYYLVPSLGPFASAPQDFASLPATAVTATQTEYLAQRQQFLHHPAASDGFSQISAFASLHVGFTVMVVLMLRYYGCRRASWAMSGYLGLIMLATVYVGWHYAIDVPAGVAIGCLAALLGRRTIFPRTPARLPAAYAGRRDGSQTS